MDHEKGEEATITACTTEKLVISDHRKDVLHQLNEYRRSSHLCDVCVVAQGREFAAHRAVLAAGGGFFSGLFAANMREQSENKIQLHQVDPDVVDDILSYIYTGEIELTRDNAQLIVMAADFLLLDKLKAPVDEFLEQAIQDIPPSDFLALYLFAVRYKCTSLEKTAFKLVRENFEASVTYSQEFLELSSETLQEIIASDDLVVGSEEVVFRAVVDWVKHKEERKSSFYQLFIHTRLCSLTEEFIFSSVMAEPLVSSNPDCVRFVIKRKKHTPTTPKMLPANVPHPRCCLDELTDAILVFPSYDIESDDLVNGPWCYIPSKNAWYHIPASQTSGVYGYGLPVHYKESIYLTVDDGEGIYIVRYEPETNMWVQVARQVNYPVSFFNVTCLQGILYFVGGLKEDSYPGAAVDDVLSCDVSGVSGCIPFDITPVAPLNEKRSAPCVVSDDNHVYAVGGHTYDEDGEDVCTNTVERYNPKSNNWIYLSPMKSKGSRGQCSTANGKIFVSQVNRNGLEFDYEVYDISCDTWSQMPRSPLNITLGVLAHCDGKLYHIGTGHGNTKQSDFNTSNILKTTAFDVSKECWSDVVSSISLKTKGTPRNIIITLGGTVVRLRKTAIACLKPLEEVSA